MNKPKDDALSLILPGEHIRRNPNFCPSGRTPGGYTRWGTVRKRSGDASNRQNVKRHTGKAAEHGRHVVHEVSKGACVDTSRPLNSRQRGKLRHAAKLRGF